MKAKGIAHLGLIYSSLFFTTQSAALMVGELLISEVMVNPAAVSDTRGEWFELYNPTSESVNLNKITISDDGSNRHTIESDLLILPQQYLVLARNGDIDLNGGFSADYVYRDFSLSNTGDEIIFSNELIELLRFDYGSGFDEPGRTRSLQVLPMIEDNYQLTPLSLQYGLGDIGTPGTGPDLNLSAVPLPAAAWLFLTGVISLLFPSLIRGQRHG